MMQSCKKCGSSDEPKTENVVFKNGTKHIKATCVNCGAFLQYINRTLTSKELADWVLPFGEYKGMTLSEINSTDQSRLRWLANNCEHKISNRIKDFLKSIGEM